MSTVQLAPSAVVAYLTDPGFVAGTVIEVYGTPTDRIIDFGKRTVVDKPFTLIGKDPMVLDPDPFGFAVLGKAPKTWRPCATSYVTIRGCLVQYTSSSSSKVGLWDIRNFDWEFVDFPDWINLGQTWKSIGYPASGPGALLQLRPGSTAGANMRLYLEDVHFRSNRTFDTTSANPLNDSPLTQFMYNSSQNGGDDTYTGMCRADGQNIAPFSTSIPGGRGPWPGVSAVLRNKRYVAAFNTELCYSPQNAFPIAVSATQMSDVQIKWCSVKNMNGAFYISQLEGQPFNGLQYQTWEENLWGDWDHSWAASYAQSATAAKSQLVRVLGCVQTGCGNLSGIGLGNPHVDQLQIYCADPDRGARVLMSHNLSDVGAQVGKANLASAQENFGGGYGLHVYKNFGYLTTGSRNKSMNITARSYNIQGLRAFIVKKAPVPNDQDSAGNAPSGSGNAIIFSGEPGYYNSVGLAKDCAAGSYLYLNSLAQPRMINNVTTPAGDLPTSIAPNANVDMRSVAESYTNCRDPNWVADVDQWLLDAENYSNLMPVAVPAYAYSQPIGAQITSVMERIHIGDHNQQAPIEIITTGLQWAEYDYDGVTLLQNYSANPGTIKDGNYISVRVPAGIATPATGKDYYYKVNGQQLKWTAVTAGNWAFPGVTKSEVGQWAKVAAGALIASPTSDQYNKGIIYGRFSLSKPSVTGTTTLLTGISGRTIRTEITTFAANYNVNFAFGSSSGGQVGRISPASTVLLYDVEYEFYYCCDFTVGASNNSGLVIRRVSDGVAVVPWFTATNTQSNIGWDYSNPAGTTDGNGLRFGNNLPITLKCLYVAAGVSLTQDNGAGLQLYDPGTFPAERIGINGKGLAGIAPLIFLIRNASGVMENRGSSSAWALTSTATGTDATPGVNWANAPGQGPKQSLGIDNTATTGLLGQSMPVTVICFGSNEAAQITPTLSAGLTLVGGPVFNMAENAKSVTFNVIPNATGEQTITFANNVGYTNPDQLKIQVGIQHAITIGPDTGFSGDNVLKTLNFYP